MKCYESGYITSFWNMLLLTLEAVLYFSYLSLTLDAESLWNVIELYLRNFSEDFIIIIFHDIGKIINNGGYHHNNQETMKMCNIASYLF